MGVFKSRLGAARLALTTRGGVGSGGPYWGFNVSTASGDDPESVARNRAYLACVLGAEEVIWLEQVHGSECVDTDRSSLRRADAAVTATPGRALAIMMADCLPVLMTREGGHKVGAAHAGWRGLAAGVLAALVDAMGCPPSELEVWLGPRIEPEAYEVDEAVHSAFDAACRGAFRETSPGHWQLDLAAAALIELNALGVRRVRDCAVGVFGDPRFYSYRRDGTTGRSAALIMPSPV